MRRSVPRLSCLAAGVLLLAGALGAWAAPDGERGFPLIRQLAPSLPTAETQSFGLAVDPPRGRVYFANLGGVLIYDGSWWQILEVGKARMAFSVAVDREGRVAVGGIDELGLLASSESGRLRYVSLIGRLPPGVRDLGPVDDFPPVPGGFVFLAHGYLLHWDGASLSVAATLDFSPPYPGLFDAGGTPYLASHDGIARVEGRRLIPVPGGEAFRGRRVDQILDAD